MDRQTNGRTPDRYIDPAPHTMRAVPNTQLNLLSCTTNRFTNVATSNCLAMVLRHVTGSTAELSEVSALSLALTFLLLLLAPAFVETPASLIHQALQVYPAVNSGHVSVYRNVSRWWNDVVCSAAVKSKLTTEVSAATVSDSANSARK